MTIFVPFSDLPVCTLADAALTGNLVTSVGGVIGCQSIVLFWHPIVLCLGTFRKVGWLIIMRVFIFEPDEIVREFLLLVSDRRGYEVFAFERPGVCVTAAGDTCPAPPGPPCADIIIADVNRFAFPSFEILEHIAHGNCKVPNIALMSGNWFDVHRDYARKLDCEIFEKPLHALALRSWLEQCEQRIDPNRKLWDGLWVDCRRKRML